MSTAATLPITSAQPKPWTPSDRDRLIFQWVKFEGQTQSWVADQLEISQSTVSRTIERYERWVARGGQAQQGALTHDERLRTQRWLTYERNERILASALRIAGEMEQATEASKSTIRRPMGNPSAETQVFTEHRMIDRSGLAARYLRLAYRINMDQLKLVEQSPHPALESLSTEDAIDNLPLPVEAAQCDDLDIELSPDSCPLSPDPCPEPPPPALKTENRKLHSVSIIELSPNSPLMHALHNPGDTKPALTNISSTTSSKSSPSENPPAPAYAVASHPPEQTTDQDFFPRLQPLTTEN